ncbi:MAG TPA: thioesterase family protein [Solirubrobacteraceae bacterium]
MPDAVFIPAAESPVSVPACERMVATDLARGPWDPQAQHGGAPAALLVRAFERQPGGEKLILARVTYELLRPVPLGTLEVHAEVVRPGRRVQLLEGSLRTADGLEVLRARALKVQRADPVPAGAMDGDAETAPGAGPDDGRRIAFPSQGGRMFATDAMDIRFLSGSFLELGPATAWFRLRHPLVAGEDPSPLQRLAAAADFGNGISSVLPWDGYVFINPDLTIYLERAPVGEWFLLESQTMIGREGIGLSESLIYDKLGRVARATQALLVSTRA